MKFKKDSKHAFDPNQFLATRAKRGSLGIGEVMKVAATPGSLDVLKTAFSAHRRKALK